MFAWENKMLEFIKKHLLLLLFILIMILSAAMRAVGFSYISTDMSGALIDWFYRLRDGGGFAALGSGVGDYNLPYLSILAALTYLPVLPLTSIKLVSVLFDYLLAWGCGALALDMTGDKSKALAAFGAVACLPTVVLNSAVWGQCDGIYAALLVCSLLCFFKSRDTAGFLLYGAALAFKLQAVFFLPFLLYYYYSKRRFTLVKFLYIPAAMIALSAPALLAGRSILDVFYVYFKQTGAYSKLTLQYPNLYAFIPESVTPPSFFSAAGILAAFAALAFLLFYVLRGTVRSNAQYLCIAAESMWLCVFLLPHMHERYGYAVEILLVVYAIVTGRAVLPALLVELTACCAYFPFLFAFELTDLRALAALESAALFYMLFRELPALLRMPDAPVQQSCAARL